MVHELKPGWLARQIRDVIVEVQWWPLWMREQAGLASSRITVVRDEQHSEDVGFPSEFAKWNADVYRETVIGPDGNYEPTTKAADWR